MIGSIPQMIPACDVLPSLPAGGESGQAFECALDALAGAAIRDGAQEEAALTDTAPAVTDGSGPGVGEMSAVPDALLAGALSLLPTLPAARVVEVGAEGATPSEGGTAEPETKLVAPPLAAPDAGEPPAAAPLMAAQIEPAMRPEAPLSPWHKGRGGDWPPDFPGESPSDTRTDESSMQSSRERPTPPSDARSDRSPAVEGAPQIRLASSPTEVPLAQVDGATATPAAAGPPGLLGKLDPAVAPVALSGETEGAASAGMTPVAPTEVSPAGSARQSAETPSVALPPSSAAPSAEASRSEDSGRRSLSLPHRRAEAEEPAASVAIGETPAAPRALPDPAAPRLSPGSPALDRPTDTSRAAYLSGAIRHADARPGEAGRQPVEGPARPGAVPSAFVASGIPTNEEASAPAIAASVSVRRVDSPALPDSAADGEGRRIAPDKPVASPLFELQSQADRSAQPLALQRAVAAPVLVQGREDRAGEVQTAEDGPVGARLPGPPVDHDARWGDARATPAIAIHGAEVPVAAATRPEARPMVEAVPTLVPASVPNEASLSEAEAPAADQAMGVPVAESPVEGRPEAPPPPVISTLADRPQASPQPARLAPEMAGTAFAAEPAPQVEADVPDTVEIVLQPEDLGRVKMTMAQDGDLLRVTVQADRAETLDLMRRHSDQLGAELRQAGFAGTSLSFGGRDGQPAPRNRPATEVGRHEAEPVGLGASTAGTGLDLRI